MFTGKGMKLSKKYAEYGLSSSSVLSLIDWLLGKGHCIMIDMFYMLPQSETGQMLCCLTFSSQNACLYSRKFAISSWANRFSQIIDLMLLLAFFCLSHIVSK